MLRRSEKEMDFSDWWQMKMFSFKLPKLTRSISRWRYRELHCAKLQPSHFFSALCTFFLFSAPSKWNVFYCITEIGAHKLRLHTPFTMDIIKGSLLVDAFSNVFMSCSCFVDIVNIYGNKYFFIVIAFVRSRSKCAKAYVTMQRSMPNLTVHWGHTAFHYERMVAIQRGTTL